MRRSGRGKTPDKVVELLKEAVDKTSQLAMSKNLGVGVASINRYINGIGEPTQETLEKLANYFNVTVSYLRGEPEQISTCTWKKTDFLTTYWQPCCSENVFSFENEDSGPLEEGFVFCPYCGNKLIEANP